MLVVGSPDERAVTVALEAALRKHGVARAEIRVRAVDRIERHAATGKLRRFVPLRGT